MDKIYRYLVRLAAEEKGRITPSVRDKARSEGAKYLHAFNDLMDKELHKRGLMVEPGLVDWMELVESFLHGKVPKEDFEEYRQEIACRMFSSYEMTYSKKVDEPVLEFYDPTTHPPKIDDMVQDLKRDVFKVKLKDKVEDPPVGSLRAYFVTRIRQLVDEIRRFNEKARYVEVLRKEPATEPPDVKGVPKMLAGMSDPGRVHAYESLARFFEKKLGQKIDAHFTALSAPGLPKNLADAAAAAKPSDKDQANLIFFVLRRHLDQLSNIKLWREMRTEPVRVSHWLTEGLKILSEFVRQHPRLTDRPQEIKLPVVQIPETVESLPAHDRGDIYLDMAQFFERKLGHKIDAELSREPLDSPPEGLVLLAEKDKLSPRDEANLVFFVLRRFADNQTTEETARELGLEQATVDGWLKKGRGLLEEFAKSSPALQEQYFRMKEKGAGKSSSALVAKILWRWWDEVGYAT